MLSTELEQARKSGAALPELGQEAARWFWCMLGECWEHVETHLNHLTVAVSYGGK